MSVLTWFGIGIFLGVLAACVVLYIYGTKADKAVMASFRALQQAVQAVQSQIAQLNSDVRGLSAATAAPPPAATPAAAVTTPPSQPTLTVRKASNLIDLWASQKFNDGAPAMWGTMLTAFHSYAGFDPYGEFSTGKAAATESFLRVELSKGAQADILKSIVETMFCAADPKFTIGGSSPEFDQFRANVRQWINADLCDMSEADRKSVAGGFVVSCP